MFERLVIAKEAGDFPQVATFYIDGEERAVVIEGEQPRLLLGPYRAEWVAWCHRNGVQHHPSLDTQW